MKRAHRSTPGTATERHPQSTREHDRDVEPVSYFNDAVFAIAMTLLVVSIRVPSGTSAETLGRALRGLGSSFTSYGISFIVIGLYWFAFHRQLNYLERFDGTTLVIDLLFLMSVAFLPFPTLLLNRYFGSISVIFYAASMAASGLLLGVLWIYPARRRLLKNPDARLKRYFTVRALYPPMIFLLSIPVAVAAPQAAEYTWFLVLLGPPLIRRVADR
jgi:TMEM175 potassium channel family protein